MHTQLPTLNAISPQPAILKSTFQCTPPEAKFKFLRWSELAVSSTWYCKGGAWPPSVAQLFLNEERTERAHAEGRNCELFLMVVCAAVVLVCYSAAVVYILWRKPDESL